MFDKWAKDYIDREQIPPISKEAEARHEARWAQIISQDDHLQYWVDYFSAKVSGSTTDEQILKYTALLKHAEEALANYRNSTIAQTTECSIMGADAS